MIDAKNFDANQLEELLSPPCPICQGNHLALNCDKKKISIWDGAAWQEVTAKGGDGEV